VADIDVLLTGGVDGVWVGNESAGLERAWYAVALSSEVAAEPAPVRLLGRDWVLERDGAELTAAGTPPAGLMERYGLVWLAPEEPVCDIPDFEEWDDPSFDRCWNQPRRTPAGAFQLTENFLDATHLPFVHTGTFGVTDEPGLPPHEVRRSGWRAWTTYVTPYRNHDDPLVATGEHPLVQPHVLTKVGRPPASVYLTLDFPLPGQRLAILFVCQPETATRTRVYKLMARSGLGADLADLVAYEDLVLDEDLAVLEQYEAMTLATDLHREVHTAADKLSIAYRRVLTELAALADPVDPAELETST
jgi:vanillate O-demethylase monooxygenase subunit